MTDKMVKREQTQALSFYDRIGEPIEAIETMAKWFAESELLGIKTEAQGAVVAMTCMAERITPFEFERTYVIIEGKPSKKSGAMRAEFQRKGGAIEWVERSKERCIVKGSHRDLCPEGLTVEVTMKELVDGGVTKAWDKFKKEWKTKANYRRHPRQMLMARASAELVRTIMPEVNYGIYAPEETEAFEDVEPIRSEAKVVGTENVNESSQFAVNSEPTIDSKRQERINTVLEHFSKWSIKLEHLEKSAKKKSADWDDYDFQDLSKMRTYLKTILAPFEGMGVTQTQLETHMGCKITEWLPTQFKELKDLSDSLESMTDEVDRGEHLGKLFWDRSE